MKKPTANLLLVVLLLLQIVAPVQSVLASQNTQSSPHKDHCHMLNAESERQSHGSAHATYATQCMHHDKTGATTGQGSMGNCKHCTSCASNCTDCSHSSMMVLNEFVFLHQAASQSPLQSSYDIYKYFPPLKLRPPRS